MLAHILEREEVKAEGRDRAYDSDATRDALNQANKEAIIPPGSATIFQTTSEKSTSSATGSSVYLIASNTPWASATHYDKIAHMFLGGILAALICAPLTHSVVNRTQRTTILTHSYPTECVPVSRRVVSSKHKHSSGIGDRLA